MFEIVFYKKEDDTKPVADFIKGLEPKMKRKTLQEIQLLKEFGTDLREPYSKSLKDGLFELRVQQSNNISRIFYFFFDGQKIVMTNGFIKKTQKTPNNEILKAKRYRADYLNRKDNKHERRF